MSILAIKTCPDNQLLDKYNKYLDECFRKGIPAQSIEEFKRGRQ
jgi:hypothetical protein